MTSGLALALLTPFNRAAIDSGAPAAHVVSKTIGGGGSLLVPIEPAFTRTVDAAARAAAEKRAELYADASQTGALGKEPPRRGVDTGPASGPTAGGPTPSRMAVLFGAQGEGAIAGQYDEYMVPTLSEHDRFLYSRFACASAGGAGEDDGAEGAGEGGEPL